jgi:CRISPR-associated exonuclease Cas4
MYQESDYLALSALQHWVFCRRQCALIHLEQAWSESALTAQGRLMHDRAHREITEMEDGRLIARAMRIASVKLGLAGVADVIEFLPDPHGIPLKNYSGRWRPYPVEYKLGKQKSHRADEVQVCAQAICLEEMLGCRIDIGALYYGRPRRRFEIHFDDAIRKLVEETAQHVHDLLNASTLPEPEPGSKCRSCSMQAQCLPKLPRGANRYIRRVMREVFDESPSQEIDP